MAFASSFGGQSMQPNTGNGWSGLGTNNRAPKPQAGMSQPPTYATNPSTPQAAQPQTFTQMQRQGQPRPPAPAYSLPQQPQPRPMQPVAAGAAGSAGTGSTTAIGPGSAAGFKPTTPAPTTQYPGTGLGGAPGVTPPPQGAQQPVPLPNNSGNAQQTGAANTIGSQVQNLLTGQTGNPGQYNFANSGVGQNTTNSIASQVNTPNPWNPQNSALNQGTQSTIQGQLNNPNPYNSQNVQQVMQQAQDYINQWQNRQIQDTNAQMAQRGIYDSSLAAGNLKDITTQAGQQMLNVDTALIPQIAQAQLQGQNSAVSNALGYGSQAFTQGLEGQNAAVGNALNLGNLNYNQGLGSTNAAISNALGYGQQQFGQQLGTAQFNQSQDYLNYLMSLQALQNS